MDGTVINNNDRIELKKKCLDLLNFVTFKKLQRKSAFLKIAAQTFEAGDFLILF